jgi:predicted regulator of Ras-like GTPase activity (Roadblock/LC7/MglB family)
MNPGVTGQPGPAALPAHTTQRPLSSSTIAQLVGSSTAHAAARPGHDTAAIKAVLAQARQREPGLSLLMLSTADGRAIAEDSSLPIDGRRLAAMANSFLTLGETVSRELALDKAEYATICTPLGNVVLIRILADSPLTLTAVADSALNLAVLLFHARECGARLGAVLNG